jgi:hypothetical protein
MVMVLYIMIQVLLRSNYEQDLRSPVIPYFKKWLIESDYWWLHTNTFG